MLNPLMLIGLLGLSVPIVIHLIHKQKLQPRLLATIRFLDPSDAPNAFAPVPRDILQLLLRLLLLALFIVVMVRFTLPGAATGTRALTVILDQSMSMQRLTPSGKTLFEQQKAEIGSLIDGMNAGDQFSLMLVGDTISAETGFLRDKAKLKDALAKFTVTDGVGRALVPALKGALQQLQTRSELNTCVLVFSDHQKSTYEARLGENEFARIIERGRVRLFLVCPPLDAKPNVAIEAAGFSPEAIYLGTSSKLSATVRNLSNEEQSVEATLFEGDNAGESRPITLRPREAARVDLAHTFDSPDDIACSVAISDDILPADNLAYSPMRVRSSRQMLLVAPPRDTEDRGVQAGYDGVDLLGYAINPGEALGLGTGTFISMKRITPNFFEKESLPIYSTIIIYGVDTLPHERSAADLARYVSNGGALYIVPSGKISAGRFNDSFSSLLGGFQFGGLHQPPEPAVIDRNEATVTNTLLLPLLREEWGDVQDITFSTYFRVQTKGTATCAMRAANGDWLAAVVRHGRGGACVQMFSCDIADSSLPRSMAFVPMVQEVTSRLGAQGEPVRPDVVRANELTRMMLPELRGLGGEMKLARPARRALDDDSAKRAKPNGPSYGFVLDPSGAARVGGIPVAGNYRVAHASKTELRPRWLAVNPSLGESDLATLDEQAQELVFGTRNVQRLDYESLAAQFFRRREIFPAIILVLFAAFAVEAILGALQSMRKGSAASGEGAQP